MRGSTGRGARTGWDTELAIEPLCEHVLDAVGRLERVRAAPRALSTANRDAESRRIAVS